MTLTDWQTTSWGFVTLAFETVWRSFILAVLCGGMVWLLRSQTAALRFSLWRWTLWAMLALPVLLQITPRLSRPSIAVAHWKAVVVHTITRNASSLKEAKHPPVERVSRRVTSNATSWVVAVPAIYLLVTLLLLLRFVYNLRCLRRIAQQSQPILDVEFLRLVHEIWLRSEALRRPRVAGSELVHAPVAFDTAEDTWILLPTSWPAWSEAKLRAVLTHEMTHVQRRDPANLQLASLATCLVWFHPLSWFLRRQLAVLAEEACDEAVVATEASPEQYASFLLDFARDVNQGGGLLLPEATPFVRSSLLKRRIERLFTGTVTAAKGTKSLPILAFAFFMPMVYLAAAARFAEPRFNPQDRKIVWPNDPEVLHLSPRDVAALESSLQADPEDMNARMELMLYYGYRDNPRFTGHMVWFIQHHPDVETLPMVASERPLAPNNEQLRPKIESAWEAAMMKDADSPVVLFNAASFIARRDPERALQILRDLRELDTAQSEKYDSAITAIYCAAEIRMFAPRAKLNNIEINAETAARLRDRLQQSGDPAQLAATGKLLVEFCGPQKGEAQAERGLDLIRRAIEIDPGRAEWKEAFAWAEASPQRTENYQNAVRNGRTFH